MIKTDAMLGKLSPKSLHTGLPIGLVRISVLTVALLCKPAQGQNAPTPSQNTDIVVTGRRMPPSSNIIDQYSEDSIAGLGAITIGEVIDRLERRNGGQLFSIIVNGRRLSEISDLRDVPPEALSKVEILGEASAGSFGFAPQNKVLNLVLKPRFHAINADAGIRMPTEGGGQSRSSALRYTNIRQDVRFNSSATFSKAMALYGRERLDLFEQGSGDALLAYRSLQPSNRSAALTAGLAFPLNSTSVNLSATVSDSQSVRFLRFVRLEPSTIKPTDLSSDGSSAALAVVDTSHSRTYQLGASASGNVGRVSWISELNGSVANSGFKSRLADDPIRIATDQGYDLPSMKSSFIDNTSKSVDLGFALSANAPLYALPAGPVNLGYRLSFSTQSLKSKDATPSNQPTNFRQNRSQSRISLYVPITSPTMPIVGYLGRLSIIANGEYQRSSTFGGYSAYDFGLDWQLSEAMTFNINRSGSSNPPALARFSQPLVISAGTLIADPINNTYVFAREITGGSYDLRPTRQFSTTARGTYSKVSNSFTTVLSIEYLHLRFDHPIVSVAYPNAFFQLYFPERFNRDTAGQLQSIDLRPFNALFEQRESVKPSVHISSRSINQDGLSNNSSSKRSWDFGINGEWFLISELRSTANSPIINLLRTPIDVVQAPSRYRVDVEATTTFQRISLQFGARWRSGSKVEDVSAANNRSLTFLPFSTANAEAALTIRRQKGRTQASTPWRISISIENIFNSRPVVRDSSGEIPAAFMPAFLDPLGRILSVRLRAPL